MAFGAASGVSVTAYTSASVTLGWTAGTDLDHYDIYRASMAATGFFGSFSKINSVSVSSAATSYVDNSTNSTTAPTGNTPYAYLVYAISAGGSQLASNVAFGMAFDGTDIVGPIRTAMVARISSVLTGADSDWSATDYLLSVEKNSQTRRNKTYGLEVLQGEPVAGPTRASTVKKMFKLSLYRNIIRKDGNDGDLNDRISELENLNEMILIDLVTSNLGLGTQVIKVERESQSEHEVSRDDNLLILSQDISVLYRISV